jgi:hypothetical protein
MRIWIASPADQALLIWCRGTVVMDHLSNPKAALLDLVDAERAIPEWLSGPTASRLAR